eukprot:2925287-Alexandrium_andersonii.AAC.1
MHHVEQRAVDHLERWVVLAARDRQTKTGDGPCTEMAVAPSIAQQRACCAGQPPSLLVSHSL